MCRSYRCGTLSFQEKASETHERFCWESFGSFGHQNLLRALDGDIFIKNLALYIQVAKCYVNFPATTAKVKANCGKCWSLMCSKTCIIHAREPLLNCDFSFCVTRASLLYFIRSWVALSFLCESVSQSVCQASVTPVQISTFCNI